ncbi:MAG: hypothetical protein FJ189_08780 [Gammaproteobacteria bacterium]|nr:hypothetical protein [Gammaproteobacteria bacterium]
MKTAKGVGVGCDPRRGRGPGSRSVLRAAFGFPLFGFVLICTYAVDGLAQEASELQAQIERQRTENQALKDRIEQFERVLKTDVCKNPEAAKLLDEEPPAAPPPEPATPQGK